MKKNHIMMGLAFLTITIQAAPVFAAPDSREQVSSRVSAYSGDSRVCRNSSRFLKRWFENLQTTQEILLEMTNVPATSLKDFSRLSIYTFGLCESSEMARVFAQRFTQKTGLLVPSDAFARCGQTVREWLEYVFSSVSDKMKNAVSCAANITNTANVSRMTLRELFGDQPYASNMGLQLLDSILEQSVPAEFYPGQQELQQSDITVEDLIERLMN